jgi:hypothetical protein
MPAASDRYWELVKEQLAEERARKNSLEQRGVAVITSAGALVTLLFGLTALATKAANYILPDLGRVLLVGAGVLFLLAGVLAIAVNWAVSYSEVTPEGLRDLQSADWSGDESAAAKEVVAAWTDIIEVARSKNGQKGRYLRAAMLSELVALTLVAAAVVVVLATR